MAVQRITTTIAEYAANGMRDKAFGEAIKNSRERLTNYAYKLITKYVPMILFTDKAKEYLYITSMVCFRCDTKIVYVSGLVIPKLKDITLPRSEFEKIVELKKKYDDVLYQSSNFYNKCFQTILELKTFSRLKKEFPEAVEFLPKESVETPNENIAKLVQILKT